MAPLPNPTFTTILTGAFSIPPREPNPSASLPLLRRGLPLLNRQVTAIIPAAYSNQNGPSPGTIVGITLGAVGGFLVLLFLLYQCFGDGSAVFIRTTSASSSSSSSVVVRSHRRKSTRASSGARSHRRETVEVRRERRASGPVPIVVVEEPRKSRPAPETVTSESSVDEDEIVVIEDPPRRSKSKSGYRTVDPREFGGGDEPLREVGRKGSRKSRG